MTNPEGQNNLPDSWELQDDGTPVDQDTGNTVKSSFGTLNVDAPAFVPGQNIHAKEFVPSWPQPPGTHLFSCILFEIDPCLLCVICVFIFQWNPEASNPLVHPK
jgi:hypothetical protein